MIKQLLTFLLPLIMIAPAHALDGKAIFNGDCTACHNIGGGRKVGPDLEGVTKRRTQDWVFKFVNNSAGLIASGDADAKKVFEEYGKMPMPPHNFTKEEIASLYEYLGNPKGGAAAAATVQDLPPGDVETGKALFTGKSKLNNGGASCVSCHNIRYEGVFSGATFAKDLSDINTDIPSESAVAKLPSMNCSYENNGVTPAEKSHLNQFLKKVREEHLFSNPSFSDACLFFFGSVLAAVFLLLGLLIRMRHRS